MYISKHYILKFDPSKLECIFFLKTSQITKYTLPMDSI